MNSGEESQRASGSHQQLHQLVAGHVLDDPASRGDGRSVGQQCLEPQEKIARPRSRRSTKPGPAVGEDAAHRGATGCRWIPRDELLSFRQRGLQLPKRSTCLNAHRQIAWLVAHDSTQMDRAQIAIQPRRQIAHVQPSSTSAGHHREPFTMTKGQRRSGGLRGTGLHHQRRLQRVDRGIRRRWRARIGFR